jgi:hypothetical protein
MKIIPLVVPKTLGPARELAGFEVEVVRRVDRVILLKKRLIGLPDFRNFEVCIIQVGPLHYKQTDLLAQGWTHAERLPPSESWGRHGWTFTELSRAEQAFAEAVRGYAKHVAAHGEHIMDTPVDPDPSDVQAVQDDLPEWEVIPEPDEMPEPEDMPEP